MTKDDFEDAKALWKFFYAKECFKQVDLACSFILDQKMNEKHPIYYPLITSIYVLYGRPFKRSNRVGKLPDDIVPDQYRQLHKITLHHRDQIYAHTDGKSFDLPDFGEAKFAFLSFPTESVFSARSFEPGLHSCPTLLISAGNFSKRRTTTSRNYKSVTERRSLQRWVSML